MWQIEAWTREEANSRTSFFFFPFNADFDSLVDSICSPIPFTRPAPRHVLLLVIITPVLVDCAAHQWPIGYQLHVTRRVSATLGVFANAPKCMSRIKICIAVVTWPGSHGSAREIVRACRRIYCEIRNVTFRGHRSVTIDAPTTRRDASENASVIDRSREARAQMLLGEKRRENRKKI